MWKFKNKNSFCNILVMNSFHLKVSIFQYCSLTLKGKKTSKLWFLSFTAKKTKPNTFYFFLSSPLTAHEYVLRTTRALCHLGKIFLSYFSFKADWPRPQVLELNAYSLTSAVHDQDIWITSKRLILNAEEYSNSYSSVSDTSAVHR